MTATIHRTALVHDGFVLVSESRRSGEYLVSGVAIDLEPGEYTFIWYRDDEERGRRVFTIHPKEVLMGQAEQWPSAGRVVHIHDINGDCRGASIIRVVGENGPDADVELFVYPSEGEDTTPYSGGPVARNEWHWPEYVGPMAENVKVPGMGTVNPSGS